jgi:hypothetical protein
MTGIIDADTHIAESESMWKLFDKDLYHRRPVMLAAPDDMLYRDFNVLWLIDGNIFPKASGKGGFRIITPTASKREAGRTDISLGCREITDVDARLADMDKAGVAVQVIYPTLFLIHVTRRRRLGDCTVRRLQPIPRARVRQIERAASLGGRATAAQCGPIHQTDARGQA